MGAVNRHMKTLKRKVKEALMVWKVKAEQKVQQYSCLERQTKPRPTRTTKSFAVGGWAGYVFIQTLQLFVVIKVFLAH